MALIWLPISYGGRTRNVLIPYSHNVDDGQLREIVDWQKEKTVNDLKKLPPKPKSVMSKKEVAGALKQYLEYLKRRE